MNLAKKGVFRLYPKFSFFVEEFEVDDEATVEEAAEPTPDFE